MRIVFSVVMMTVCSCTMYAQSSVILPVQFTHFFKTYTFVNPSSIGRTAPVEIMAGNKSLSGAFSGVRTIYANANFRLRKDSANRVKHVLGISFINDREGVYITRSRASALYAFHLPLSTFVTMSAGAGVGFVNYAFNPSNISTGGSDIAPNLELGLWLRGKNFNFGISGNQLVPFRMTPLDATYVLSRHYTFLVDKTFFLSPSLKLMPAFQYRWEEANRRNADGFLVLLLQDNLTFGAGYKYQRALAFSAGLEKIKIGNQVFRIMFSYNSPVGKKLYYNHQAYDLLLSYSPGSVKIHHDNPEPSPEY